MSNITSSCIFPLVNTKYEPYVIFEESPCGISCQDPLEFFVFFTRKERARLKDTMFIISLITVFFTPFYFCIVLSERAKIKRNIRNIPFSYQCPLFISSGYLLVTFITTCPFVFGAASIICNEDEWTRTQDSFHNVPCTLTAFGVYIGIRLTVFYTCALSVSLALALYFPKMKQKKRYYHFVVWACIFIGSIPIYRAKSISGDYNMGFCTTTLSSRFHLLWMNIVPFSSCIFVFCVCLAMATFKLLLHNDDITKLLSVNAHMRSLFNRLLVYNFLQTTAVSASVGNFYYWYVNSGVWHEAAFSIVTCQIQKTMMQQTSIDDYELCLTDNEDLSRPRAMSYWVFHLCALISVSGAIVFQCSLKVQRRSATTARMLISTIIGSTELSEACSSNSAPEGHVQMGVMDSSNVVNRSGYSDARTVDDLNVTDTVISRLSSISAIEDLSISFSVPKESLR